MGSSKIIVFCRPKPILAKFNKGTIETFDKKTLKINESKRKLNLDKYLIEHTFKFDRVFDYQSTNLNIYESIEYQEIMTRFKKGTSCAFMAYGQTGTGKTHTIFEPTNGLAFLTLEELIKDMGKSRGKFEYKISLFEIYMNQIRDLLDSNNKVELREIGGKVVYFNLSVYKIIDFNSIRNMIRNGLNMRQIGSTSSNQSSSRSHVLLRIIRLDEMNFRTNIESDKTNVLRNIDSFSNSDVDQLNVDLNKEVSFIFADLAGNERGDDRINFSRKLNCEGASINRSLLVLKECIRGLDCKRCLAKNGNTRKSKPGEINEDHIGDGIDKQIKFKEKCEITLNSVGPHYIPFRQTKLTRILKPVLTSSNKAIFLATISGHVKDIEHTLNTLSYADKLHGIKKPSGDQGPQSVEESYHSKIEINNKIGFVFEKPIIVIDDGYKSTLVKNSKFALIKKPKSNSIIQKIKKNMKIYENKKLKDFFTKIIGHGGVKELAPINGIEGDILLDESGKNQNEEGCQLKRKILIKDIDLIKGIIIKCNNSKLMDMILIQLANMKEFLKDEV